jgi:hypothetical protein
MTPLSSRAVWSVLARPSLWGTAAAQLFALAPSGWWRHRPFLPVPDPDYLGFRLQTMYGDPAHVAEPDDVVTYLKWCRTMRGLSR